VAAQRREIFPVFGGMEGSTKTILNGVSGQFMLISLRRRVQWRICSFFFMAQQDTFLIGDCELKTA
jgi:hypothetical protein